MGDRPSLRGPRIARLPGAGRAVAMGEMLRPVTLQIKNIVGWVRVRRRLVLGAAQRRAGPGAKLQARSSQPAMSPAPPSGVTAPRMRGAPRAIA